MEEDSGNRCVARPRHLVCKRRRMLMLDFGLYRRIRYLDLKKDDRSDKYS